LESITESLSSLSMSIKDNGTLYQSETKYYVGIPIALAEFQLLAMPKSQLVRIPSVDRYSSLSI